MKKFKRVIAIMFLILIMLTQVVLAHEAVFLRFLINTETLEFAYDVLDSDTGWGNDMDNHRDAEEFNSEELAINKYGYMTKFDKSKADKQGEPYDLDTENPYPGEYYVVPNNLFGKTLDKDRFNGEGLGDDKADRKITSNGVINADGSGELNILLSNNLQVLPATS